MNYFDLFELPFAPSVNKADLSRKYFELQRKFHPDFFSDATEQEREDTLDQSAAINKAFNTFKDEQKTIEYFLQEKGLIYTDEKYSLPNEFLMEMMEINELLEENDQASNLIKVNGMAEEMYNEVKPVIERYSPDTTDLELLKIKEYYYKKKYLNRILDRLVD